jgi:hypothetical protein
MPQCFDLSCRSCPFDDRTVAQALSVLFNLTRSRERTVSAEIITRIKQQPQCYRLVLLSHGVTSQRVIIGATLVTKQLLEDVVMIEFCAINHRRGGITDNAFDTLLVESIALVMKAWPGVERITGTFPLSLRKKLNDMGFVSQTGLRMELNIESV